MTVHEDRHTTLALGRRWKLENMLHLPRAGNKIKESKFHG